MSNKQNLKPVKPTESNGEIKELSNKHNLFVHSYIENKFNATKAYMEVYGVNNESARRLGSLLLTNVDIRQAIDKIIDESVMADKKELAKRVIEEYKKIAFSDVKNLMDIETGQANITPETDTSVIESIQFDTIVRDKETTLEKTKYKLYNKINALDSLSRFILGFTEKHEVDVSGNLPVIINIKGVEPEPSSK